MSDNALGGTSWKLPPNPLQERKPVIRGECQKIILNVLECCEAEESQNSLLHPITQSALRTAAYTGTSQRSISRIKMFAKNHPDVSAITPGKKRKRSGVIGEAVDEYKKRVIRDTIEEFYTVHKVVPSVGKLLPVLERKIGWRWSSTSLRNVLKSIGFVWRKVENKTTLLLERGDIVDLRSRFLVAMKNFREAGAEIFYLDETWLDSNLTWGKCRQRKDIVCVTACGCPSIRLIIGSVGSKKGFIRQAELKFLAKSTQGDFHGEMNSANFEKWLEELVLPNLPPNSVIIIGNAPYHNRQVDKPPTRYDTKESMIKWLQSRKIECQESMSKDTLYTLIRKNRAAAKSYAVDIMATSKGHKVIRLPPYNCDLNASDLAWEKIKGLLRERNITGHMSPENLLNIVSDCFQAVTEEDWQGYYLKVQHLEQEYWRHNGVMETATENLTVDSSSDSSDESDN